MAALSPLVLRITTDLSDLDSGLRGAGQRLQNLGSTLTSAGTRMTAGITLPIVGAGVAALRAAANLETAQVAFATMLGSGEQAASLLADLQKFGAETPFEFPEIQQAARSLLAFGTSADEMIPTLTTLGDIASGVGMPFGELAQIYGKAKVQGRLFMEDVNQLTGRGIPVIQEFAKQFGVSESEVRGLVESGQIGFPQLQEALQSLTGEGGRFQGMMQAQSETMGGLVSTFRDNVTGALVTVGQTLVDTFDLKTKLAGAVEWMGQMTEKIRDFAANNPELFRIGVILAGIAAAAGPLLIVLGAMASGLGVVAGALAVVFSPVGLAIAAIVAAVIGLRAAWETNFAGIREFAAGVWTAIQTAWEAFKALFSGDWDGFLLKIGQAWQQGWTAVTEFLGRLWAMIQPKLAAMWESLKTWWGNIDWYKLGYDAVTFVLKAFTTFWTWLVPTLTSLWNNIKNWFTSMDWGQLGSNIITGIINGLQNGAQAVIDMVIRIASGALDAIKNFFGIESPSTVFQQLGQQMVAGLALGLGQTTPVEQSVAAMNQAAWMAAGGAVSQSVTIGQLSVNGGDAYDTERMVRRVMLDVMRETGQRREAYARG